MMYYLGSQYDSVSRAPTETESGGKTVTITEFSNGKGSVASIKHHLD